jgi:hypothetical protein
VCFEYREVPGGSEGIYWYAWNERDAQSAQNKAIERTARQRAHEIAEFKAASLKSGGAATAEAIAAEYTKHTKSGSEIDAPFIRAHLAVFEKVCKYPECVEVIEILEREYGLKSCLNSTSKLLRVAEKCNTAQERICVFKAILDGIERGFFTNGSVSRDFLVANDREGLVPRTLFRWRARQYLLATELPREKLAPDDIQAIAAATMDYDTYRRRVQGYAKDVDVDSTWIGTMRQSGILALRVVQATVTGLAFRC